MIHKHICKIWKGGTKWDHLWVQRRRTLCKSLAINFDIPLCYPHTNTPFRRRILQKNNLTDSYDCKPTRGQISDYVRKRFLIESQLCTIIFCGACVNCWTFGFSVNYTQDFGRKRKCSQTGRGCHNNCLRWAVSTSIRKLTCMFVCTLLYFCIQTVALSPLWISEYCLPPSCLSMTYLDVNMCCEWKSDNKFCVCHVKILPILCLRLY